MFLYNDFNYNLSINPIPLRHFRAWNIRGWTIWSTPSISSSEIVSDLKLGVVLVHDKRAKHLEKCFDDIIIFVNDVIKFAKFGSKSNCAYLLKDKPLLLKMSNLAA